MPTGVVGPIYVDATGEHIGYVTLARDWAVVNLKFVEIVKWQKMT